MEQSDETKVEEAYKLHGFDKYLSTELTEDGEGPAAPAAATLASVPGMGAPVLPGRGIEGSGDVPSPPAKKKKKKRVHTFDQFLKKQ